jgi:hypothetical protein
MGGRAEALEGLLVPMANWRMMPPEKRPCLPAPKLSQHQHPQRKSMARAVPVWCRVLGDDAGPLDGLLQNAEISAQPGVGNQVANWPRRRKHSNRLIEAQLQPRVQEDLASYLGASRKVLAANVKGFAQAR